jgi:hypothetical protein
MRTLLVLVFVSLCIAEDYTIHNKYGEQIGEVRKKEPVNYSYDPLKAPSKLIVPKIEKPQESTIRIEVMNNFKLQNDISPCIPQSEVREMNRKWVDLLVKIRFELDSVKIAYGLLRNRYECDYKKNSDGLKQFDSVIVEIFK